MVRAQARNYWSESLGCGVVESTSQLLPKCYGHERMGIVVEEPCAHSEYWMHREFPNLPFNKTIPGWTFCRSFREVLDCPSQRLTPILSGIGQHGSRLLAPFLGRHPPTR